MWPFHPAGILLKCTHLSHLSPFSQCFKSTVWPEHLNLVSWIACRGSCWITVISHQTPLHPKTHHVRVHQERENFPCNCTVRNLAVTFLAWRSRWLSPVTSHVDANYPQCRVLRRQYHLCVFFPWTHNPVLSWKKHEFVELGDILQNAWPTLIKTVRWKDGETPRTETTRQLDATWGLGTEREYQCTNWGNPQKVRSLVTRNVLMFIS